MIKKLTSIILALLLLFSGVFVLFSCEKKELDESESGFESNTESTQTDKGKELLKIVENGNSEYVVVYPNDASDTVIASVNLFIEQIESKTGVLLKSKSDNLRGKPAHDPNEKAILIGKTNYDETNEVLATLGRFEYRIAQVGNKMVILGLSDPDVKAAVEYYVTKLLKSNIEGEDGSKTLLLEEYHYIPEAPNRNVVTINGTDIIKFSIVYPQDDAEYKKTALKLQENVLKFMGVELPIYSDNRNETEYEILIGRTERKLSETLYDSMEKYVMTYSLEVSGSKLQILSGGYYSAYQCVNDMCFYVLNNGEIKYTDGSYLKKKILPESSELTSGADIRVMTSNLGVPPSETDKYLSEAYRTEMFAGALLNYQPDAVGLQELGAACQTELSKWLDILKNEYGIEYTLHNNICPNGRANYISILYRSDMYDCIEEDTHMYPHWDENYSQGVSITMCHLQSKVDSSKHFILMNTHWDVDLWEGAQKDTCSAEATNFVNKWKSAECPIFFTGDWNANRGTECLENFITATGAQTADEGKYCIEFTFYFGEGVTAKKNECVTGYSQMGDHPFRYTDFDI